MTVIAGQLERKAMWTGRWMRLADGTLAPVIVDVPVAGHVHNGTGEGHYRGRGFRDPSEIPPEPPADEIARLTADAEEMARRLAGRKALLADTLRGDVTTNLLGGTQ